MNTNLLSIIQEYMNPEVTDRVSEWLGESAEGVRKSMDMAFPGLIGAYINKTNQPGGAEQLDKLLKLGNYNGSFQGQLLSGDAGLLEQSSYNGRLQLGQTLGVDTLLGLTRWLSSNSGMLPANTTKLLSLSMPILMDVLGKIKLDNNLGATGLKNLLATQRDYIAARLPEGFNNHILSQAVEPKVESNPAYQPTQPIPVSNQPVKRRSIGSWLVPLLILGAIGALCYHFYPDLRKVWDNYNNPVATDTIPANQDSLATKTPEVAGETKEVLPVVPEEPKSTMATLALPDSTTLTLESNSIEYQLGEWLAGSGNGKKQFLYKTIPFNKGEKKLLSNAPSDFGNLINILKAYPKTDLELYVYGNEHEDEKACLAITEAQAESFASFLKQSGISKRRIKEADGHGNSKPMEGVERRMEIHVTK